MTTQCRATRHKGNSAIMRWFVVRVLADSRELGSIVRRDLMAQTPAPRHPLSRHDASGEVNPISRYRSKTPRVSAA